MRAVGPVLSLVGGAAVGLGGVAHFSREPSLTAGVGAQILVAIGVTLFTIGYALCIANSRPYGRAATAFVVHSCLTAVTTLLLYLWLVNGGDLRVAAVGAATLVAQLAAGAVILIFAGASGRKVGPAFMLSLTAFLATVGGAAFFTWKGW